MNNDFNVLEELYKKYKTYIFSYFYSQTYNKDISDELTQEVFLKAFRAIPTYRGKASFKNWLYVIAKNLYINWSKKNGKCEEIPLDKSVINSLISKEGQPEKSIDNKERKRIFRHILSMLKEEYRTVLILRDFEGFSYDEIANTLNWSLSKVKVTLYRARIQFKSYLKKEGDSI